MSTPAGKPYTGTLTLDCGGGTVLRNRFELSTVTDPRGPIFFGTPWFGQPEQRCMRELIERGPLRFTLAEPEGSPPALMIDADYPLGWALAQVKAVWAQEMQDAEVGRCRLRPPLAPPF